MNDDLRTNAYGPVTQSSLDLARSILEEADKAEELDVRARQVGYFFCHTKTGRNSERPFVVLFSLSAWRSTHLKARALGREPLIVRDMTEDELRIRANGPRAKSTVYATLTGLLRDEMTVTQNGQWCGLLRTAYGDSRRVRVTDEDWESSGAFIREIIAKEKNPPHSSARS